MMGCSQAIDYLSRGLLPSCIQGGTLITHKLGIRTNSNRDDSDTIPKKYLATTEIFTDQPKDHQ